MCIAIVKPIGKTIDKDTLRICSENNKDGCGFAYINVDNYGNKRLKVRKSMVFEEFYTKYEKAVRLNPNSPFLIHFRIKTHGAIDLANCHPFRIDKNHVFIHNGTISGMNTSKDLSDTRAFNQDMLRVLPKNWNKNSGIKKLVEDFIGFSKLAVLDIDGNINIYNEQKGYWVDGIWFSNKTYEERQPYVPAKTKTYNYTPKSSPFVGGGTTTGSTSGAGRIANIQSETRKRQFGRREWDENSYIPCDYCTVYHPVKNMEAYYQGSTVIAFCPHCAKVEDVWMHFDQEDLISDEAHVDWLTEESEGVDLITYETVGPWRNPWGISVTLEEMEEAKEDAYQLMLENQYAH